MTALLKEVVPERIRVMLADDSAVVRGMLTRMLEADPEIVVVASVGDGQMAVRSVERLGTVEVVVLDLEMPRMDGLTALPELMRADPNLQVIIASSLTLRNADISLKALAAGAKDTIPKPSSSSAINQTGDFKRELVAKIKALGEARRRLGIQPRPMEARSVSTPASPRPPKILAPIKLRPMIAGPIDVIAIGSSTGGPQALFKALASLPSEMQQPILITQHMPPTFTTILAEHLTRSSGRPAREGQNGEPIEKGRIYVAPGDHHMVVEARPEGNFIRLNKDAPESFCRPSVDPMVRSILRAYGRRVLGVILTGMGQDGLKSGHALVEAGANLIAQDEATSVVWGMPGAVASAGICAAVLPISEIGPQIQRLALKAAPR